MYTLDPISKIHSNSYWDNTKRGLLCTNILTYMTLIFLSIYERKHFTSTTHTHLSFFLSFFLSSSSSSSSLSLLCESDESLAAHACSSLLPTWQPRGGGQSHVRFSRPHSPIPRACPRKTIKKKMKEKEENK